MHRRSSWLRWISRVPAFGLAAACSQPLHNAPPLADCDAGNKCGVQGGMSAAGGGVQVDAGSCGNIVFGAAVCNSCASRTCCTREAACSNSPDCIAILQCVSLCPPNDKTCEQSCLDLSQNGVAPYQNFIDCVNSGCATECRTADGGSSCGTLVFANQACTVCVSGTCCREDATCSNNPSCLAIVQCTSVCPATDQACIRDCEAQQPDGVTDFETLSQCVSVGCSSKCP
jgi:hypothetical protein